MQLYLPGLFHTQIGVPRDAEGHPVDDLYAHKELIEPWLKGVPLDGLQNQKT